MPKKSAKSLRDSLDALIRQITGDAQLEAERVWAFRQAFAHELSVPCEASVIGESVTVLQFVCDGNDRRGVAAECRRADGSQYTISVADLVFPAEDRAARYVAAYRKWIGLTAPPVIHAAPRPAKPVELVVLSVERLSLLCRHLGSERLATFRTTRTSTFAPGEILSVLPTSLTGGVLSNRIDAAALGLVPLKLEPADTWNPAEEYWGEPGDPIATWAKPIIKRGPRPRVEMEQVLPGTNPDDPYSDPISRSNDLKDAGNFAAAEKLLNDTCEADLRCLDAHAHLGNFDFDRSPKLAIRHYEIGVRIGELSLAADFDGVLPWGMIDNRPFLRCMHGYGLCLWRLGNFDEAYRIFGRMLWLNPTDNQGVRFLLDEVKARVAWEDSHNR